ncbi:hypothetical protein BC831DRAFT_482878 [Entophlyctis helioformis]|nr:hypothetical protein BC831DRAFT_482878 [Entophlyctis helioformis]
MRMLTRLLDWLSLASATCRSPFNQPHIAEPTFVAGGKDTPPWTLGAGVGRVEGRSMTPTRRPSIPPAMSSPCDMAD